MALLYLRQVFRGARSKNLSPARPAFRTEIDQPVGRLDDVEVVFDHDDSIALVDEAVQDQEQFADVFEVQAGGGLVEDVDAAAHRPLLQLGRKFHPLGLSTGQGRRTLSQADVAEADLDEGFQVAADGTDRLEELGRLADRHVQYLGDVLALVTHGEGVAVIASTAAHLAGDVDIRQEVHLDLDGSVARAVLAAAALDIETEAAGQITARLGVSGLCEESTDLVEDPGVRGRVRARGAADRVLVDMDDLVEIVEPSDPGVLAGNLTGAIELIGEDPVQDVIDQGRFAGTADPGDPDERSERELDRDVLKVIGPGSLDDQLALLVDRSAGRRHRYGLAAG